MTKLKIVEFLVNGKSVFRRWFDGLDAHAAAKITTALYRLEEGNLSKAQEYWDLYKSIKRKKL